MIDVHEPCHLWSMFGLNSHFSTRSADVEKFLLFNILKNSEDVKGRTTFSFSVYAYPL